METIYIILGLIMLVFGILQIILFFKLWKMTNDVHAIKENKPVDKNTPEDTFWELRKYILLNNVEKAEDARFIIRRHINHALRSANMLLLPATASAILWAIATIHALLPSDPLPICRAAMILAVVRGDILYIV